MSLSSGDTIFLVIGLIDFVGAFISIGISLHLAYTKMDVMLNHLQNCPAVMIRAPLRNAGAWGNMLLLGAIMGVMTTPQIYLRDGGANAEDLKNFPASLKRKLIILQWTGWGLLLVMLGLFAVIKLELV
ncbi:hypothetical protein ACYZTL_00490 [Pseudomonas sp. LB3P81]